MSILKSNDGVLSVSLRKVRNLLQGRAGSRLEALLFDLLVFRDIKTFMLKLPPSVTASILAPSAQRVPHHDQEKSSTTTQTKSRRVFGPGEDAFSSDEEDEPPAKVNSSRLDQLSTVLEHLAQFFLQLYRGVSHSHLL